MSELVRAHARQGHCSIKRAKALYKHSSQDLAKPAPSNEATGESYNVLAKGEAAYHCLFMDKKTGYLWSKPMWLNQSTRGGDRVGERVVKGETSSNDQEPENKTLNSNQIRTNSQNPLRETRPTTSDAKWGRDLGALWDAEEAP